MEPLLCLGEYVAPYLVVAGSSNEFNSAGTKHSNPELLRHITDSEWHSISLDDSNKADMEYIVQVLKEQDVDMNHAENDSNHSNVDLELRSGLQLALCGFSRRREDEDEEAGALPKYSSGLKSDRPMVSMEAVGGANGVKEVRVRFHGLDDGLENGTGGSIDLGQHLVSNSLAHVDDGCFSLMNGVGSFICGAKQSFSGLVSGATKVSFWDSLSTYLQSGYTSPLSSPRKPTLHKSLPPSFEQSMETSVKHSDLVKGRQNGESLDSSSERKNVQVSSGLVHPKADVGLVGQLRADVTTPWMRDGEPRKSVPRSPSGGLHANCKKPPKPPRPPRSASDMAIAAEKRAARKKVERTPKRKCRSVQSASTGVSPIIALILTVLFGALMVFQGLFVQTGVGRTSFSDDSSSALTDLQPGGSLTGAVQPDSSIAEAFHKSMLDLHQPRHLLSADYGLPS